MTRWVCPSCEQWVDHLIPTVGTPTCTAEVHLKPVKMVATPIPQALRQRFLRERKREKVEAP